MPSNNLGNATAQRQYFEHPRSHLLRRHNGTSNFNGGTSLTEAGEGQCEQWDDSVNNVDKKAPKRNLTSVMLLGIMYTYTICGAYAIEETVMGGGPLFAIISIFLIPILMAAPTAVIVSELATAVPSNAAFLMWINISFHRVVYFVMIILSFLLIFIDNAIYPVLFSTYVCTAFSCSPTVDKLLRAGMLLMTYTLNVLGIQAVGTTSVLLSIFTVIPFLLMFSMQLLQSNFYLNWPAISFIPSEIDWPLFITTASWNLCGLEQAATVSEEVTAPHKTIIRAFVPLLGLAYLTYIPPILTAASIQSGPPDLSQWVTGFWSHIAYTLGGTPLRVFVIITSSLSAVGLMLSSLCTTSHIIAGVAWTGVFPGPVNRILYRRNKRFGTYHWTLTINALITGIFSILLDFGPLVKTDQVLYGIRVLMIFLCFFIIRYRYPNLNRPFRVPLEGYKLGLLLFPMILFVALIGVAMMESWETVIINVSVLGVSILLSIIYAYYVRNKSFYGGVVTLPVEEDSS